MLNTLPVAPLQNEVFPVIAPAAAGAVLIVIALVAAIPLPHEFTGVTVTLPLAEPKDTVMLAVPAPAVMVAPVGTVQL